MAPPRSRRARSERAAAQLELWGPAGIPDPPAAGAEAAGSSSPRISVTRALAGLSSANRALNMVRETLHFFPELDGAAIRVGLTRSAAGFASMEEDHIWVNPYRLSRHTIAHELAHLLERRGLVPRSERGADLFALARHPDLADDLPAYVRVPASFRRAWTETPAPRRIRWLGRLLHETARDALHERDTGRRAYAVWFEMELDRRWREAARGLPGS